jgi:hypothetical protein
MQERGLQGAPVAAESLAYMAIDAGWLKAH